jgi:putative inorganic carbon (hco3(-)) transporter
MSLALPYRMLWLSLALLLGLAAAFFPTPLFILLALALIALAIFISPLASLALMLVLAPLRTLIATESPIQSTLDIGQIAFLAFIFLWWFHRILQRQARLKLPDSPVFLALACFTIVAGFSAFSALSLTSWLTEWLKWLTILVMVAVTLDLAEGRRWEWIVAILIASGLGNALVGLYIFFGGSGADHLLTEGRFFRAFGTFGQPNPFGGFMGLLLPLSIMASYAYGLRLFHAWRKTGKVQRSSGLFLLYYGIATATMLAAIVASWSRGAWLGFVLSLAVMAFALPRKLWQSVTLGLATLIIIGGLWLAGLIPASIEQRILSSTEELFSFSDVRGVDITSDNYAIVERLAHWQAAMTMAQSHPWLGIGFGNYEIAYNQYRLSNWEFPLGHAHNYYLNILAEAGIIGLLFYSGMWLTIIWNTWKARSHPDLLARSLAVGLMGTWAYLAFHSLLDNLYVNNLFLHLGIMLGLLASFVRLINHSQLWGLHVRHQSRAS